MPDFAGFRKASIPVHRSVRGVQYQSWRPFFWFFLAAGTSVAMIKFGFLLSSAYSFLVKSLLNWAGVPGQSVWVKTKFPMPTPAWQVASYNSVLYWENAAVYITICFALIFLALKWQRISMPLRAWAGMIAGMLLISVLVLFLNPLPRLGLASFSCLWVQATLGVLLVTPWVWALVVGLLPLPLSRLLMLEVAAGIVIFVWSACRLALFLALANWAGFVWLPIAIILFGALPDLLVLVVAYGYALEPAGRLWRKSR